MSLQVFLQGKILGFDEFLQDADGDLEGRAAWASLLSEVLPRGILAELKLSPMLLGASGGDEFLLLLPDDQRPRAQSLLDAAAEAISRQSAGALRLAYGTTENLGTWSDIRKRLHEDLHRRIAAPAAQFGADYFGRGSDVAESAGFTEFGAAAAGAQNAGWSADAPGVITLDATATHTWTLDEIGFMRHRAPADDDDESSTPELLASRAVGRWTFGVLAGEVDAFAARLRQAQSAEEHLTLVTLYKQFFANEIQMRCSLPEFWRKVTVIRSGSSRFAVYGAWDALVGIASDLHRVFSVFVETNLKDYAGAQGKTVSMGLALADGNDNLAQTYAGAKNNLEIAKSSGRDSIYLLGRVLDWKQLGEAADTRQILVRLIDEFGVARSILDELAAFYREAPDAVLMPGGRRVNARVDRPWRFYRRLNAVLGISRNKEFQKLRADLVSDFTGRNASVVRLRPQGRVALEWAKLETVPADGRF
jgi:CRISPR-associated protein Csm1